jgi:DNA topoisomerase-1
VARKSAKSEPKKAEPAKPRKPAAAKRSTPKAPGSPRPKRAEAADRRRTGKSLVIVESPKKARAINKFLGSSYVVKASMGHVRDLPKRRLGLDVEAGYAPNYEIVPGKKETVGDLKREADRSELIYLATDPDREGEAIAWHLQQALGLADDRVRRVLFYEITERAVRDAFHHVGPIDMNKVNAQQARRFLDRFVGYQLSPLLWRKIRSRNLSAGRVQSVSVRLIVEREKEIRAFVTSEYWKLTATLSPTGSKEESDRFTAELAEWQGKPFEAANEAQATSIRDALAQATYRVDRLEKVERSDRPEAPFKTSTLQQQATIRLRFSGKKAMKVAQELYEGIDVDGSGPVGLITYMRTDSLRVSDEALTSVRHHIEESYGPKYLPAKPNRYAAGKLAQEAHEAIRPTELTYHPDKIRDRLTHDQHRLYSLIYRRFVASQMTPALFEVTNVEVAAGQGRFKAQGKILRFDGYRRVLPPAGKQEDTLLPPLHDQEPLDLHDLAATQHFTQPPPRYSEATLIKALEKENIGRPSTYAPIIQTIQDRGYVEQKERRFFATDLGMAVTDYLVDNFPKIMDLKFTGHMEDELDDIVTGKEELNRVLDEFYYPFQESLKVAEQKPGHVEITTGENCPDCQAALVMKFGRTGAFIGCSRYPDCKFTRPINGDSSSRAEETEHLCPACHSKLKRKDGKRGPFLYCSGYPKCKEIFDVGENGEPVARPKVEVTEHVCPKCGKPMILRQGARGAFLGCSGYPKCRSTIQVDDQGKPVATLQIDVKCAKCGGPMGVKTGRRGAFLGCLNYPKCRSTAPIPEELKEKVAALEKPSSGAGGPDLKSVEVEETCDQCGGAMVVRRGRRGFFLGCASYPKCKGTREPGTTTMERIQALTA